MTTIDSNNTSNQRPTFLTVLCILTFIGSGLGLLAGLLGLFGSSFLSSLIPGSGSGLILVSAIGLIASAGKLFGAFKMWGLQLQGLWIYIGCEVLALIGSIIGANSGKKMAKEMVDSASALSGAETLSGTEMRTLDAATSAVSTTQIAMAVVFSLLFIGLYWINKKHLK